MAQTCCVYETFTAPQQPVSLSKRSDITTTRGQADINEKPKCQWNHALGPGSHFDPRPIREMAEEIAPANFPFSSQYSVHFRVKGETHFPISSSVPFANQKVMGSAQHRHFGSVIPKAFKNLQDYRRGELHAAARIASSSSNVRPIVRRIQSDQNAFKRLGF